MKFIFNFFKDIFLDIKWLFIIVIRLFQGKDIVNKEKWQAYKAELKTITPKSIVKESGYWLLAVLFALVIGWYVASQYYQLQCNNLIIDEYINKYGQQCLAECSKGAVKGVKNVFNYTLQLPS